MTKNELQADASFLEAVDAPLLELHKSNILKLEIDELLDECRLNVHEVSWAKTGKDYVALLSNILAKIPQSTVNKAEEGCPFTLQSDKVASLEMPKDLTIVPTGSFAVNCLTKKSGNANVLPTLDCAIVVPNLYWNSKDYLNHRYMDKRNMILWTVAKFLSGKKFKKHVGKVEWRYYNGNQYLSALIFTPLTTAQSKEPKKVKTESKSHLVPKFTVQLVMAMESIAWIPMARLFPNRSNVKGGSSTPYYNSMLLRDASWREIPSMILEDMAELPFFGDAWIITKIWCLQRGFLRGHDSLDELQLLVLLLYLFRSKRAGARVAPLQVFTILMKFLAEEWTTKVLTMPDQGKSETQTVSSCENAKAYATQAKHSPMDPTNGDPVTLALCHEQFSTSPAVLLNSAMTGNFLGSLSPAFCQSVSVQAKCAVECLNSSRSFTSLFMTTDRFWTCLDSYFNVPLKDIDWKEENLWGVQSKDLGDVESLSRGVVSTLKRALGDRISDIRLLTTGNGHDLQNGDPDQIPTHKIDPTSSVSQLRSNPVGMDKLVVGLKINPDACHRAVDRGPPADDISGVKSFLELWGDIAELRRFKDGAIVHAVVWNTPNLNADEAYAVFDGSERTQGGTVERIIQHVLSIHFFTRGRASPRFLLRDMLSLVEGVQTPVADTALQVMTSTTSAHRRIINSLDSLAAFLRKGSEQSSSAGARSTLGLPLQIDAVEPLSPFLRYSSVFPAIPHPMLGGDGQVTGKVAGVISYAPIQVQIRFGMSSKWPTDLKAIGAAKAAMLSQLAEGIESMKKRGNADGFEGPIVVTPFHLTLGYQGYSWRILVRADPELYLLRGLHKPSDDARRILDILTKEHVTAASHHATIHSIHTFHPSAGHVVRLLNSWMATHMLSGLIPHEAVELLVAKVYSDGTGQTLPPATVVSGFLRTLRLLANHDWVRHPLIVDPQGHLSDNDLAIIRTRFDEDRGPDYSKGPSMYIIAPYDCKDLMSNDLANGVTENKPPTAASFASWRPTYTQSNPERLLDELSDGSHQWRLDCHIRETQTSLKSFSVLLRVDNDFVLDAGFFSSTKEGSVFKRSADGNLESIYSRSAKFRFEGPKALRRKVYRNLNNSQTHFLLHDWRPVEETVTLLRQNLGSYALFFYNEFAPEVIAVLWRPTTFQPKAFSAINSEYVRPVESSACNWKSDSLVVENMKDLLREIRHTARDIVVDVKVLDDRSQRRRIESAPNSKKRDIAEVDSDDENSDSE